MIDQRWSWALMVLTVVGLRLAGLPRWRLWGWGLSLVNEITWAVYAVVTEQWGFLAGAVLFGATYAWNFYGEWRRQRQLARTQLPKRWHPARREGWERPPWS
jgi:hypothetical protein